MKIDELWDDYLQFLIWNCNLQKMRKYSCLFSILHHIEFEWVIDRDDNRADDGICLRDDFEIDSSYDVEIQEEFYNRRCSVMEMLVALAIRVTDDIIGDPSDSRPEKFFMEMIKNLELINVIQKRNKEYDIKSIIFNWMHRNFEPNGCGSPFPVKYDIRDQRSLEIWDQVNSYINENYT